MEWLDTTRLSICTGHYMPRCLLFPIFIFSISVLRITLLFSSRDCSYLADRSAIAALYSSRCVVRGISTFECSTRAYMSHDG